MSERQRFHPMAIAIYWLQLLRGWLFYIVIIVINGGIKERFGIITLSVIFIFSFVLAMIRYKTRSYTINADKIVFYHGIFRKKETDIPYERIQTIKQRQWFFLKPFNLIQILIETAGGNKATAEGSLPAVDAGVLETLENFRYGRGQEESDQEVDTTGQESTNRYRVTDGQIVLYGITDLSILASLAALVAFATEMIPDSWFTRVTSTAESLYRLGWIVFLGAAFVLLVLLILISLAKNFIQFYNFTVSRTNRTLTIESGLFERKVQKIPTNKIQGIRIRQQVLRKLLKISSVEIILAGGQETSGENNVPKKLYILPIVPDQLLYPTLARLIPEWEIHEPEMTFASYPSIWYFWRWHLLWLPVLVAGFIWNPFVGMALVLWIGYLFFYSWLDYRYQGYAIQTQTRVCIQNYQALTKVQTFIERPKIQAFSNHASKWLYNKKLGHSRLTLKTGLGSETIGLKFIKREDQETLKDFYLSR